VRMEMEATMPDATPEAVDPTAGMDGSSDPAAAPAAPAADDPLKALQDSMNNEKK
jgi:hypothetical protein